MAWLCGIAINVAREMRRKRRPVQSGIDLAALPSGDGSHDDSIADDGMLNGLASALGRLPDRQREAVVCRFLQDMSLAATAKAMGCAEGTVKAAVFAAMGNLRRIMKAEQ